jgi:hypothetical protein
MNKNDLLTITRGDMIKLLELKALQTRAAESLKHDPDRDKMEIIQRAIMSIQQDINKILPVL